jgi:hypothetical protein
VFDEVTVPDVRTGGVSGLGEASATLEGEVNPDGVEVTECYFEYGETTSYGTMALCETEGGGPVGNGNSYIDVHAGLSGLESGFYHYRLVVRNQNGAARGKDKPLGASVDASVIATAAYSTAELEGEIDPHGFHATCRLQYTSEAAFQADGFNNATSVPCEPAEVGEGTNDVPVAVGLAGLTPGSVYRFRFQAQAGQHVTDGPGEMLYTYPSEPPSIGCPNETLRAINNSTELPDCRAYEQVSPPFNAEAYPPIGPHAEASFSETNDPEQAAPDGDAVIYAGENPDPQEDSGSGASGGGGGNQILASRGEDGWSAHDITPLAANRPETYFEWFTSDLSLGVLSVAAETGVEHRYSPEVRVDCTMLYARSLPAGAFSPFFTEGECGQPFFVGGSSDGSSLVFESMAAQTANAQAGPAPEPSEGGQEGHDNIYDLSGGQLHLVNILPGASPSPDPNASVGAWQGRPLVAHGAGDEGRIPSLNAYGVVSSDGGQVFWTDLSTGVVFERRNPGVVASKILHGVCTQPEDACSVQVSAGAATYEAATPDGRFVYYSEGGVLWRWDSESEAREQLTGTGAEVLGVIGVNQTGVDGAYVYLVADGVLAGNENGNGETAQEGEPNLYVIREGVSVFVARLSPGDNELEGLPVGEEHLDHGVWQADVGYRAAQLTPDGTHLVFMANERLTSYDNTSGPRPVTEIYIYDAGSGQIACVSCTPSGAEPLEEESSGSAEGGIHTYLPFESNSLTRVFRVVSSDGGRVFFDTEQALVPQDTDRN